MPKRGENIYKRKDGRYEGRYIRAKHLDGSIQWGYVYSREYAELRRLLSQKKAEYEKTVACTAPVLEDWLFHWLENSIKPYVKAPTYTAYKRQLENYLCPGLGSVPLQKLTASQIQLFVDGLAGRLAPSTVKGICRILRTALQEAVKHGLLPSTPYQSIREPRVHPKKPRILTRLEQKRLEQAALQHHRLEVLLCLYAGLRLGEVCALRWEDVDFMEGILHVRRTIQRVAEPNGKTHLHFGPPKSEAGLRAIPLPDFLLAILQAVYTEQACAQNEYVIRSPQGGCYDPRTLQDHLKGITNELGLQGVHMHTLRHTYAARCREQGIGLDVLAQLMGHSDPTMTLRFYGGCTQENIKQSVKRLGRIA